MSRNLFFYDHLRPVAPQVKWWIVGTVAAVLGTWELVFHFLLMGLPVVAGHRLNALIAAVLVAGTVLAFFGVVQRYEQQLAAAAVVLREKNEALRALEAERDNGLLDLARDLALTLVDITDQCEIARGLAEPSHVTDALGQVEQRARGLQSVLRSLICLREDGAGLTEFLPAVLDDYRRHREASQSTR